MWLPNRTRQQLDLWECFVGAHSDVVESNPTIVVVVLEIDNKIVFSITMLQNSLLESCWLLILWSEKQSLGQKNPRDVALVPIPRHWQSCDHPMDRTVLLHIPKQNNHLDHICAVSIVECVAVKRLVMRWMQPHARRRGTRAWKVPQNSNFRHFFSSWTFWYTVCVQCSRNSAVNSSTSQEQHQRMAIGDLMARRVNVNGTWCSLDTTENV